LFSLPLLYIRKRLLWDMAQAAKYYDEDFQGVYCFLKIDLFSNIFNFFFVCVLELLFDMLCI
jgi:hypothetical protein